MAEFGARPVHTVSGGQLQRAYLARAIGCIEAGAGLLLADERTAALDFAGQAAVAELLTRLPVTVLVVTHDRAVVERCERVLEMAASILEAAPPIAPPPPRGWLPRGLLCGVAVAQLTLGMAQVLGVSTSAHGGHTTGVDSSHLFNESTAWNLALGLGLLWTALRPAAVAGMLPVTAAFVAVLIPYSTSDLINGTATAARVLSQSLLLAGLVLLAFVHFSERGPDGRTPLQDSDSGDATGHAAEVPERAGQSRTRRRVRLRPVSRRRAA